MSQTQANDPAICLKGKMDRQRVEAFLSECQDKLKIERQASEVWLASNARRAEKNPYALRIRRLECSALLAQKLLKLKKPDQSLALSEALTKLTEYAAHLVKHCFAQLKALVTVTPSEVAASVS